MTLYSCKNGYPPKAAIQISYLLAPIIHFVDTLQAHLSNFVVNFYDGYGTC